MRKRPYIAGNTGRRRPQGSGTVKRYAFGYVAFGPQRGAQRGVKIGHFDTEREADRAREKWLKENPE